MTTRPPELESGPGSELPNVQWCISMLEWMGWSYKGIRRVEGVRTYKMVDCNGETNHLTTYGLRYEALRMWFQHGAKPEKNFGN